MLNLPFSVQRALEQGSPAPAMVCGLLGTRQHGRMWVAVQQASKTSSVFTTTPITHMTSWAPPPVGSAAALDSHRSMNPTVNCACERSRLCAPHGNHPQTIPIPIHGKNCLPQNQSLMLKMLGTAALLPWVSKHFQMFLILDFEDHKVSIYATQLCY